ELLLELVGVVRVPHRTGLLGPLDGLDLALGARGGNDGQPTREQEVTSVSAFDLDDVARRTELVDVGGEDQLHDPSTFLSSDDPTWAGLSRGHISCLWSWGEHRPGESTRSRTGARRPCRRNHRSRRPA